MTDDGLTRGYRREFRFCLYLRITGTQLCAQGTSGDDLAHSSIRFSLGRFSNEAQVDYTIEAVTTAVTKLREMSPLWEMFKEGIDLDTIEWANIEPTE